MDLFVQYLREFNRDYLSTRKDLSQTVKTVATFVAIICLIGLAVTFMRAAMLFWGLEG